MNDEIKFVPGSMGAVGGKVEVRGSQGGSAQGVNLGDGNVGMPDGSVLRLPR